ncbi:transcriptional regulator, AraC family [Myroides odoratimimus]|uniref:helix-turn-helix domain-containing protein n=1 Tax=Myroides odoratimimus TaxID=76832 RepID=UPI0007249A89|nr:helix-turn-helix domain-containing protein [Myroides odoratimimus]GAQ15669.1 transcriptional regulator, AraC family [Myroides odoratimimus]STZ49425.1 Bacillibactin transport regulator [Myroides odoratimimus]
MNKTFNIPSFLKYINVNGSTNDAIQVIHYDQHKDILLKSLPVELEFYLMAIKKNIAVDPPIQEMSNSYIFLDKPGNLMEWDLSSPFNGYGIFVNAKLLDKFAKDYTFTGYTHHEALYLTERESDILYDLFIKAYEEFQRDNFSQDVLVSYATLILSYTQTFYERQFEGRSKIYNKVVADFYTQLDQYFDSNNKQDFPTVAYFATKANLSVNYFGDVVKHFTEQSPIEHIHQHIIQIAKNKLLKTKLSINEIAYSLGFEYPTYFTRFFRKKTGISPKVFRNQ